MPSDEEAEALEIIASAIEPFAVPEPALVAKVYRDILHVDPLATPQEIARVITDRGPSKRRPGMAYFMTAIPPCFPLTRRKPSSSSPAPAEDDNERRRRQAALLDDPQTSEAEKRVVCQSLGVDYLGAKARKAGQS